MASGALRTIPEGTHDDGGRPKVLKGQCEQRTDKHVGDQSCFGLQNTPTWGIPFQAAAACQPETGKCCHAASRS